MFTAGLHIEKEYLRWLPRSSEVAVEDVFIRKFIVGTFQNSLFSEVVIKRRANMIILAFITRVIIGSFTFICNCNCTLILPLNIILSQLNYHCSAQNCNVYNILF